MPGARLRVALTVGDPRTGEPRAWGEPAEVEVVRYQPDPDYTGQQAVSWARLIVRTIGAGDVHGGVNLDYSLRGDPVRWTAQSDSLHKQLQVSSTIGVADILAAPAAKRERSALRQLHVRNALPRTHDVRMLPIISGYADSP